MLTQKEIIKFIREKRKITSSELTKKYNISRQYVNVLISELIKDEIIVKVGSTRNAFYILKKDANKYLKNISIKKILKNVNLEEHIILQDIKKELPALNDLKENIKHIFDFAFSEMLNNAIEHSKSEKINIEVSCDSKKLIFNICDFGEGVFNNVMKKKKLQNQTEAIQDILKGKTTTMPSSHTGEGIFFTSKIADKFILDSYEYKLIINNNINDIFIEKNKKNIIGTNVIFEIDLKSNRSLSKIFKFYTPEDDDYSFSKTSIKIKLYTLDSIYISRSEARRVVSGLEKFKTIIFDFDKVAIIGQAFADEIFRVFQNKNPQIKLEVANANKEVDFMIKRIIKLPIVK